MLERATTAETRGLDGETAAVVTDIPVELSHHDGPPTATFGGLDREALDEVRGTNNPEDHSLAVLENAVARGWPEPEGEGEARLLDAVWHGLARPERP